MSNARNLSKVAVESTGDIASSSLDNATLVSDTSPQLGGDLNLNSNDITGVTNNGNVKLNTASTPPSSPVDGQFWWDNTTGNFKIYDSTQSGWFLVKSGLDGSSSSRALPSIQEATTYIGNSFPDGVYYINTPDGGVQQAYLMYAEDYVWVLVGRFAANASQTVTNTLSSQRSMIDISQNGTSMWSADWGSQTVEDTMIWGATDFANRQGTTVNWVYQNQGNQTLRAFWSGQTSGDNTSNGTANMPERAGAGGPAKNSLFCYGARDGVFKGSRWVNNGFVYMKLSDASTCYTNPYRLSNPGGDASYWHGSNDAKLTVSHTNSTTGQDYGYISQGFGYDDGNRHFADFYSSEGGENNTTTSYSSAVTIWARFY